MLKKQKNSKYSPYLTIYKPQVGNMISILERITGISLIIFVLSNLIIIQLYDYFLLNYNFYYYFFIIFKGNS